MRLALLMSGQGRQQPEHWAQLQAQADPALAQVLAAVLGPVWHEPHPSLETLQTNAVAQPLIFGWQMHLWAQLQGLLPTPICVAGYSVGEMAACAMAGGFNVLDGTSLCAQRAALMDACVKEPSGLMAVLGLPPAALADLLGHTALVVAIRNGPDHVVLGGTQVQLDRAQPLALALGASKVVRLGVSTPSHTSALAPASQEFSKRLAPLGNGRLRLPLISAMDGRVLRSREQAMQALAQQICTTLDWSACLSTVAEMQPDAVLELGPGSALSAMWDALGTGVPARASDEFRGAEGIARWVLAQSRG
jgi:[acyl-carrier-protein] S-malonyltransferase